MKSCMVPTIVFSRLFLCGLYVPFYLTLCGQLDCFPSAIWIEGLSGFRRSILPHCPCVPCHRPVFTSSLLLSCVFRWLQQWIWPPSVIVDTAEFDSMISSCFTVDNNIRMVRMSWHRRYVWLSVFALMSLSYGAGDVWTRGHNTQVQRQWLHQLSVVV